MFGNPGRNFADITATGHYGTRVLEISADGDDGLGLYFFDSIIDIVECPDECSSVLRVPIDRISAPFVFGLQSVVGVVEAMVGDDDIGGVKVFDNASVVTGELPDIESVAVDASFLEPGLIEFFFLSRTHRKGIARMVFDLFIGTEWSNGKE